MQFAAQLADADIGGNGRREFAVLTSPEETAQRDLNLCRLRPARQLGDRDALVFVGIKLDCGPTGAGLNSRQTAENT